MPIDENTLANVEDNDNTHYAKTVLTINWPESWEMDRMQANKFPPIKIYLRDPIELISYLFIDPEIMFGWQDQVKLRHYSITELDSDGNVLHYLCMET